MTRTQIAAYHRPGNMSEAWGLLADDRRARAVSGGTDLAIACPPEVTTLVDVSRAVPATISLDPGGNLDIGAMATLTALAEHPEVAAWATGVIPEMLGDVGSPLLRNVCTIGGHLARGKLSDVIPVLLALDAEVTVFDGHDVRMPLADYYGERFERPHLLGQVHLPVLPGRTGCAFSRFARTAYDFPMANCCARVSDDGEVRIVVGAVPHRGQRAREAEQLVAGRYDEETFERAAQAAAAEIVTGSSWVASAEYRTQLVRVLVRRCLQEAAVRLGAL